MLSQVLYATSVLTVLLRVWSSAHRFLEEILTVTRVSTVWPNLCKAEKTSSHLTPTGQHSQLERGPEGPVRDLCQKRWSLEEKYWWPGSSELCESCRGSLCSVPLIWCRFQSGSGWSPPVHRCPSDPGFGGGSKYSVVSGLHHQSCFQRYHWATKSCNETGKEQAFHYGFISRDRSYVTEIPKRRMNLHMLISLKQLAVLHHSFVTHILVLGTEYT